MESPHTENKVISYDFFIVLCFCIQTVQQQVFSYLCVQEKKRKQYMEGVVESCSVFLGGGIIPALWLWDVACRHGSYPIAWHSLRKYVQKPLMYFTCYCLCQSNLFFISTWLLCIFYFFFSQKEFQHLFNKSEKGCKQNAVCRSNRDWRQTWLVIVSQWVHRHQRDANGISLIANWLP